MRACACESTPAYHFPCKVSGTNNTQTAQSVSLFYARTQTVRASPKCPCCSAELKGSNFKTIIFEKCGKAAICGCRSWVEHGAYNSEELASKYKYKGTRTAVASDVRFGLALNGSKNNHIAMRLNCLSPAGAGVLDAEAVKQHWVGSLSGEIPRAGKWRHRARGSVPRARREHAGGGGTCAKTPAGAASGGKGRRSQRRRGGSRVGASGGCSRRQDSRRGRPRRRRASTDPPAGDGIIARCPAVFRRD